MIYKKGKETSAIYLGNKVISAVYHGTVLVWQALSDVWTGRGVWRGNVSIHAPTRGATAYSAKYRILIYKSSHFANINQTITFKVIKSLEFL